MGGLGASICQALSQNGYAVAVVDLKLADVQRTAAVIEHATAYAVDVRREESVQTLYDQIGTVPELIVNNAGIARFGNLLEQQVSNFEDVVQTNLIGAFIVGREGARRMIAAKSLAASSTSPRFTQSILDRVLVPTQQPRLAWPRLPA